MLQILLLLHHSQFTEMLLTPARKLLLPWLGFVFFETLDIMNVDSIVVCDPLNQNTGVDGQQQSCA